MGERYASFTTAMSGSPTPDFHALIRLIETAPDQARDLLRADPALVEMCSPHVGETPLHYLAIENRLDAVRMLIALGADVSHRNAFNGTPLLDAASLRCTAMCELLIGNGADVDAQDHNHESPLTTAIRTSQHDLIQRLIVAGANVNLRGSQGRTPLFYAWDAADDTAFDLLVNAGARLDHRDDRGNTLLDHAIIEADMRRALATENDADADLREAQRIGALLRRGADASTTNGLGTSADAELLEVFGMTADALMALPD